MTLMKSSLLGPFMLILLSSSRSSSSVSGLGSVVSKKYSHRIFPQPWYNAQSDCRSQFTDLAIIYQKSDLDQMSLGRSLTWVGLYKTGSLAGGGSWTWTVGGQSSSFVWALGHPKDYHTCAVFNSHNRKLHGTGCQNHFYFHCQDLLNGGYTFSTHSMTWTNAQDYCKNHSQHLLTFSAAEKAIAKNFPVWIGLHREGVGQTWKWSSGSSNYRRWGSSPQTKDCVYISSVNKYMATRSCSESLPYVCVSDNLVLVKENKTWEEALEHCRAMVSPSGSSLRYDLASVQPGNDQDYMTVTVRKADTDEVWVSLRFLAGHWLWTTGADLRHPGLPKCPDGWRHCGVLTKDNGGNVEIRNCAERRNFLCYQKK